jgi:hypothetical protein
MSLKDTFTDIPPREKSGSTTSDRYDYQKNWSLMTLLEHHLSGCDYLFVFDFHEDMLVFDSEEQPKKIAFYQVKTNDTGKNWSLSNLITGKKKKKGEKPSLSFVGKLYQNKINYPSTTSSLNFVSNAKYDVALSSDKVKSTDMPTICCNALADNLISQISSKLIEEHGLKSDPEFKDITFLHVSGLSLDDHTTHIKGKLGDFMEKLVPGKKYIASAVYKSLYGEINRRTNYNKHIANFNDMVKHKAIGKKQFQGLIEQIGLSENYDDIWTKIENRLNAELAPVGFVKSMKTNFDRYEIDRMNKTNTTLGNVCAEIKGIIKSLITEESQLLGVVNYVMTEFNKSKVNYSPYTEDYIKAVILATYYEN